jgi:hypothetical protein
MSTEPLVVVQADAIGGDDGPAWLVHEFWSKEGVGILGGLPKSCKSWLALDVALSVASGTPALGTYAVPQSGPVLLFAAEDPPRTVRSRLKGIAESRGLDLACLPLQVILASSLRLDTLADQVRLSAAVSQHRPVLLVLDPFVRLHRIDENSALEVSGILAYLRDLQRKHKVAILVVHHSRKAGAGSDQAGLSLRGSGDFHAWGDDNLYMRRRHGALELTLEHRSAASPDPVSLALRSNEGQPPHLVVTTATPASSDLAALKARALEALSATPKPVTQELLRAQLQVRLQRLVGALRELESEGRILRSAAGWRLIAAA